MENSVKNWYMYLSSYGQIDHATASYNIKTYNDLTLGMAHGYEMALIEVIMKKNYFTVPPFTFTIYYNSININEEIVSSDIDFIGGIYANFSEFSKAFNSKLEETRVIFPLEENRYWTGTDMIQIIPIKPELINETSKSQILLKITPRCGINIPETIFTRYMGDGSGSFFNEAPITEKEKKILKISLAFKDYYNHLHTLAVISPNVISSRINNRMVPVLRLFNIDNYVTNETSYLNYSACPIYIPFITDYINKIQVLLTDTDGKILSGMNSGETLVLVHIRQINYTKI